MGLVKWHLTWNCIQCRFMELYSSIQKTFYTLKFIDICWKFAKIREWMWTQLDKKVICFSIAAVKKHFFAPRRRMQDIVQRWRKCLLNNVWGETFCTWKFPLSKAFIGIPVSVGVSREINRMNYFRSVFHRIFSYCRFYKYSKMDFWC